MTQLKISRMSPQLLVTDIDRAIEFYTQKLGFEVEFLYEDFYAGIIKDGHSVHLKLNEDYSEKTAQSDDLEIMFSVDDIESWYQELTDKQVTFTQQLRAMPYGKEFYIADPDGNVLAFFSV